MAVLQRRSTTRRAVRLASTSAMQIGMPGSARTAACFCTMQSWPLMPMLTCLKLLPSWTWPLRHRARAGGPWLHKFERWAVKSATFALGRCLARHVGGGCHICPLPSWGRHCYDAHTFWRYRSSQATSPSPLASPSRLGGGTPLISLVGHAHRKPALVADANRPSHLCLSPLQDTMPMAAKATLQIRVLRRSGRHGRRVFRCCVSCRKSTTSQSSSPRSAFRCVGTRCCALSFIWSATGIES